MIRSNVLANAQASLSTNSRDDHYGLCYIESSTTNEYGDTVYNVVVEFDDGFVYTNWFDEGYMRYLASVNHDTLTDTIGYTLENVRLSAAIAHDQYRLAR